MSSVALLTRRISGALLLLLMLPAAVAAHDLGPNYDSVVKRVVPATPGLEVTVNHGNGQLSVVNRSGRALVFEGYDKEPYIRFAADGLVEVNERSPAHYLNSDFYGSADVPERASAEARPVWKKVNSLGRHSWHDHRIHWMSPKPPPNVADADARTKIFDWSVPLTVSGRAGEVQGTLYWVPTISKAPIGSAVVFALCLVIVLLGGAIWLRRMRRDGAAT